MKKRNDASSRTAIDTEPLKSGSHEIAHSAKRSGCVRQSTSRRSKMPGIERHSEGERDSKRRMEWAADPSRHRVGPSRHRVGVAQAGPRR